MTDPAPGLVELAGQLAGLRERVERLAEVVAPIAAELAGAGPRAGRTGPPPADGPTWCWSALTGEEAALAWATLIGWVDWLTARYGLAEVVPACWYRHGALVEELTALRCAWTAAYTDPQARPADPALWHDLLARTLARVREWDRQECSLGTHRDDEPLPVVPEVLADRAEHVRDDLADRDGLTAGFPPPQLIP